MHAINVDGYNLATFHLVKYTNDEEIQEYMDTSETKYKNICISCCMFSVRAAELSVPAELSRSLTDHKPCNKHMQGGILSDSSLQNEDKVFLGTKLSYEVGSLFFDSKLTNDQCRG